MRATFFFALMTAGVFTKPAFALDCPCTWEEVLCRADAVVEVQVAFATETSRDRMDVRRVLWNRTDHRLRRTHRGSEMPAVVKTRLELLGFVASHRHEEPH